MAVARVNNIDTIPPNLGKLSPCLSDHTFFARTNGIFVIAALVHRSSLPLFVEKYALIVRNLTIAILRSRLPIKSWRLPQLLCDFLVHFLRSKKIFKAHMWSKLLPKRTVRLRSTWNFDRQSSASSRPVLGHDASVMLRPSRKLVCLTEGRV